MATKHLVDASARQTARLGEDARQIVASRVRELCEGKFSGRALAAKTGLGIGTVLDLMAGRSDPTLSTLLAIADALELTSIEQVIAPVGTDVLRVAQRHATSRSGAA